MQGLTSIKQALGMANLQKAMSQDAESMDALVKMMEQSVTPHKGQNVDIKL
ncbi:MAG: YjfB family protein [Clostridia bacterium]|nr:YjfB family protein [Clostridia bacterium]